MTASADQLAKLPEAARAKAARIIADVGQWAGKLLSVQTAPIAGGGTMVTLHFEGGAASFVVEASGHVEK